MAAEYADPKISSTLDCIPLDVNFLIYSGRDLVELFVTNIVFLPEFRFSDHHNSF